MGGTSNTLVLVDTSISGGTTLATYVVWVGPATEKFPAPSVIA